MTLRTAVVGAGSIADRHLSGLELCPRTELTAVCDVDERRAIDAARTYDVTAYVDLDELLRRERPDWLHVCTPVGAHLECCMTAIESGVPVLVEKPVTETIEEYERLAAASRERDVPVAVVHQTLYEPAMRRVAERIQTGRLGPIRGVDVHFSGLPAPDEPRRGPWTFELPGGEFEEGLPHPIYVGLGLAGRPRDVDEIQTITALSGSYDRNFTYDQARVQYVSRNETCCSIAMHTSTTPQRFVHVHGEHELLTVDLVSQTVEVLAGTYHSSPGGRVRNNLERVRDRLLALPRNGATVASRELNGWKAERRANPHYYLYEKEARSLERGEGASGSLYRAGWVVQIMEAIREAARREDGLAAAERDGQSTDG